MTLFSLVIILFVRLELFDLLMKKFLIYSIFALCIIHELPAEPKFEQYKNFISASEGVRNKVYVDTLGNYTVGIGHLIGKNKPNKLYYTDAEINKLFASDLQVAINDAKFLFPSFNNQPDNVQLILVSLSYNLGKGRLSKFIKFRKHIEAKNYKLAAMELKDSLWAKQVKTRADKYIGILNRI